MLDFHEAKQRENPAYGLNYGHFTIADNMSISDDRLRAVLATYDRKSIWYARDILGQRRAAEGLSTICLTSRPMSIRFRPLQCRPFPPAPLR